MPNRYYSYEPFTFVWDEDKKPIDPASSPEQYAALMRAVAERNRRISGHKIGTA